jgi:alkylation response protein AidB-like acyl-CoA dehydrogenase
MLFEPNETQRMVQQAARDYATRVIVPQAGAIDKEERFPREILKGLAELGLMAVNVAPELGGAGAGVVSYSLAMQEVARACASTAVTMAVTNMVGEVIAAFGSDEQKSRCCPKLASGEYVAGAFALSETGAGSDPGAMGTTAKEDGDSFVLDGGKQWITSGAHAGVFVVWARTGDRQTMPGTRGISCFLVEGGTPGLEVG